MSKTESGYAITIRAFLPCGNSSAEHVEAKKTIETLAAQLDGARFQTTEFKDEWKLRRKVAESSDG